MPYNALRRIRLQAFLIREVSMTNHPSTHAPTFLSTLPAGREELQLAKFVVATSIFAFLIVLPFAATQLSKVWAFIPIYESVLVINDLVTAVLLIGQFMISRANSIRVLVCGYLFTALMACMHALSFPGLFSDSGLLGGDPQTTAWLYMFWHAGFPLCVIAYTQLSGEARGSTRYAMFSGIAWVVAAVCGLTLLAALNHATLLPAIMQGNHYTPLMKGVVGAVWLLSVLALAALWRRRGRSVLDLWLIVVMCAWLCDIALSAVFNAGRFDLGFYAGRLYGLLAATFVLLVLLVENGWLYARLVETSCELQRLVIADPLTGIANRRAFDDALAQEWRRSARTGLPLSLLMVDVDNFKLFNDRYGHVGGDNCLRAIAAVLTQAAQRSGEVAARYGGEEFAVLLPYLDAGEASQFARNICQSIAALEIPHAQSPVAAYVTVSIGVASVRLGKTASTQSEAPAAAGFGPIWGPTSLVMAADEALYAAKKAGRNQIYNGGMLGQALQA